jgi:cbb3-type cytochrome oxidase subunit 3
LTGQRFIIGFLCAAIQLSAQTVHSRIEPDSGHIGDVFTLNLSVRLPDHMHVDPPRFEETLEDFNILSLNTETTFDDEYYTRFFIMELTTFDTGYQLIPSLQFNVNDSESDDKSLSVRTLKSDSLSIYIESVLGKVRDVPDIHKPLPVPVFTTGQKCFLVLLGLLFIGLIYIFIRYKKKSSVSYDNNEIPLSPFEIFQKELKNLSAEGWHEKEEWKLFYLKLTTILKNYIEQKFYLHISDLSTSELIPVLKKEIPELWTNEMSQLLQNGDLVKFAKQNATKKQCLQDLKTVNEWCKTVEKTDQSSFLSSGIEKST